MLENMKGLDRCINMFWDVRGCGRWNKKAERHAVSATSGGKKIWSYRPVASCSLKGSSLRAIFHSWDRVSAVYRLLSEPLTEQLYRLYSMCVVLYDVENIDNEAFNVKVWKFQRCNVWSHAIDSRQIQGDAFLRL